MILLLFRFQGEGQQPCSLQLYLNCTVEKKGHHAFQTVKCSQL